MRNLLLICALALPTFAQSPSPQAAGTALPVVTITRTGVLTVDGKPVNIHYLNASVERHTNATRGVYLRAEKDVPFDLIVQVLSELQSAKPPVTIRLEMKDTAPQLPPMR